MSAPQLNTINPVQVFTSHYNAWLHQRADMSKRYSDAISVVSDRSFNLFLNITSIAVAFLAVVLPLTSNSSNLFYFTSYLFFLEVVMGISLMLINVHFLEKDTLADAEWVDQCYEELIDKAAGLLLKAQSGTITQNDLNDYWTVRDSLHNTIDQRNKERRKRLSNRILRRSWIFYVIFILGVLSLLINIFIEH